MLRVLLTNFHPGDGGGHTTYINALLTSADPELELHVAAPKTSKLYKLAESKGHRAIAIDFPGKIKELRQIVLNCRRLRDYIASRQIQVIHCNGSPDHRLVLYTLLLIPHRRRPRVVFTKHNSFLVKNNAISRIRYSLCSDHVIVVCTKLRSQFLNLGMPMEKVSVIENGVDTVRFRRPKHRDDIAELREQLGLPISGKIFVSCAGSAAHKGWHYLAKAAQNVRDVYVVVLGSEPSKSQLNNLFGSSPPLNLIFPGIQSDVRPYLWASDVGFVLSTSVETISFACREMMSASLPVIVSDFGCLPDNISSKTGWVTEAGNERSVKDALFKALAEDLPEMGNAAQKLAEQRFRLDYFQSSTFDVYRTLLR